MTELYLPQALQNPTPYAQSYWPQTQGQKASEIASEILPSALHIGLEGIRNAQLLEAASLGARSAGAAAATSTGASAASSSIGMSGTLGAATSTLSVVGGVVGALNLALNWGRSSPSAGAASGIALGATVGSFIGGPGIGTAIGAAFGLLGGALIGAIKVGKHRDQQVRDVARDALVQSNILDQNYQLPLADGSTYNMGLDGGPKSNLGGRRPFEVDTNNPLAVYALSWVSPIVELLFQGDQKLMTDFTGYFANAALSNATSLDDVRDNVNFFLKHLGISDQQLAQAVIDQAEKGRIPEQRAASYLNGIDERLTRSFMPPEKRAQPQTHSNATFAAFENDAVGYRAVE